MGKNIVSHNYTPVELVEYERINTLIADIRTRLHQHAIYAEIRHIGVTNFPFYDPEFSIKVPNDTFKRYEHDLKNIIHSFGATITGNSIDKVTHVVLRFRVNSAVFRQTIDTSYLHNMDIYIKWVKSSFYDELKKRIRIRTRLSHKNTRSVTESPFVFRLKLMDDSIETKSGVLELFLKYSFDYTDFIYEENSTYKCHIDFSFYRIFDAKRRENW